MQGKSFPIQSRHFPLGSKRAPVTAGKGLEKEICGRTSGAQLVSSRARVSISGWRLCTSRLAFK